MKWYRYLAILQIILLLTPLILAQEKIDMDFRYYKGNSTGLLYDYLGKENI